MIQVSRNTVTLHLSGVDLCDGTPVLDVKPYVPHYDSVNSAFEKGMVDEVRVPRWVEEGVKVRREVQISEGATSDVDVGRLKFYDNLEDFCACVREVLASDVRSVWQTGKVRDGSARAPEVGEDGGRLTKIVGNGNTQQIDSVVVEFKVEKGIGEWEGSGGRDRVIVEGMRHV